MTAIELRMGDVVVWRGEQWRVSRPSLSGRSPVVLVHLMCGGRYEVMTWAKDMAVEVVR